MSLDEKRDCIGKTGADRTLCDNGFNDNTMAKANDKSRIKRNKNNRMRDEVRSKELNNKAVKLKDMQPMKNQNSDIKPCDSRPIE